MSPEKYVEACLRRGINCVAVTDHNTIAGALVVKEAAPFPVIIGEEVRSSEGDIIGLFLKDDVPKGLTPVETVLRIKEQGGLVYVPHPYDRHRGGGMHRPLMRQVLPDVDIIEVFNARTTQAEDDEQALRLATERDIAQAAASDAHSPGELGTAYMEMPEYMGGPEEFLKALKAGRIVGKHSSPLIHLVSRWAVLCRKLGVRKMPGISPAASTDGASQASR